MKKIVLGISGGISFLIFLILLLVSNHLASSQLTQTMAERWSSDGKASQISCFFSVGSGITEDELIEFEHTIDNALTEASVVQESENPGARLWADAYSADGQVTLTNDKTSLTADAIGIGGDFFLFHPLTLLSGSYFSGNDLMQDYCVIDEDAAWQLFGSNDVAGMTVYISGNPHIVTGVIRRPSGRLAEAAGLDSTLVYVSYNTLTQMGTSYGINHYEVVMPNPVTGFAYNYVKEKLGSDEKEVEVVENTSRYSLLSRLKLIGQFGTRSMNGRAIIYPYWENIARGYADILMVLTLFGILFLLYPVGLAVVFFCIWWRHKGWTMKDVWHKLLDLAERRVEKIRENRKRKKEGPESGSGDGKADRKAQKKEKRRKHKERRKSEYDDFDEVEDLDAPESDADLEGNDVESNEPDSEEDAADQEEPNPEDAADWKGPDSEEDAADQEETDFTEDDMDIQESEDEPAAGPAKKKRFWHRRIGKRKDEEERL